MNKTLIINNENQIDEGIKILKCDGLIIFKTETVLGLGCSLDSRIAFEKIFDFKGRDSSKPLSVHVGALSQIKELVSEETLNDEVFNILVENFLPGAVTLIVNKNKNLKYENLKNLKKVGVRFPDDELFMKFIREYKEPILATSLNYSNEEPLMEFTEITKKMCEELNVVNKNVDKNIKNSSSNENTGKSLDGKTVGKSDNKIDDLKNRVDEKKFIMSSTVIDLTVSPYVILREGKISKSKIDKILSNEK